MAIMETTVSVDEVLRESYRIKDELAKSFDYDIDRLLTYLRSQTSQDRPVTLRQDSAAVRAQ